MTKRNLTQANEQAEATPPQPRAESEEAIPASKPGRKAAGAAKRTKDSSPRPANRKAAAKVPSNSRSDTKQARLIAMLKSKDGASIDEISGALDWQKHTVRGALAGALKKKLGLAIASEKVDGRGRVYRIA